jgi:hypothetical protein
VKQAAREAGYTSCSAFVAMFRRVLGLPPKKYADGRSGEISRSSGCMDLGTRHSSRPFSEINLASFAILLMYASLGCALWLLRKVSRP